MRNYMILLLALLVSACASTQDGIAVSGVDENTGEAFTHAREVVHLTTTRPALSAVGKDYLVMSPVTTNTGGSSRTYLWFGLGSTIDRQITGAAIPSFDRIVLIVDGQLMPFDVAPWSQIARAEPLNAEVDLRASFASRVTRNQLAVIAAATTLEAYVTDAEHRSPVYVHSVGDFAEWRQF